MYIYIVSVEENWLLLAFLDTQEYHRENISEYEYIQCQRDSQMNLYMYGWILCRLHCSSPPNIERYGDKMGIVDRIRQKKRKQSLFHTITIILALTLCHLFFGFFHHNNNDNDNLDTWMCIYIVFIWIQCRIRVSMNLG